MEALGAMRWGRFGGLLASWGLVVLSAFGAGGSRAGAQTGPVAPQTTLTGELQSLAGRAATIFVGQVVSVERRGGVVEVTFRVDQAVAGQPGATYVLREWAGLWPQGQYRYTVGLRALVFLHGLSAAGLGSPLDGAEGVVPVLVQGANEPALLDVRRLASALLRTVGTPLPSGADGAIELSDALAVIAGVQTGSPAQEPVRRPLPGHGPLVGAPGGNSPVIAGPGRLEAPVAIDAGSPVRLEAGNASR